MQLNQFTVPAESLKVTVSTTLESESLTGETSSTAIAHKGIKPKEFGVSFVVRYDDKKQIGEFYRVAQAINENGDLVVYDITDRTANSAKVLQVVFTGRIEQRELDGLEAWSISFKLKEFLSVAEKTEQRLEVASAEPDTTEGVPVSNIPESEPEKLTGFQSILKKIDSALA